MFPILHANRRNKMFKKVIIQQDWDCSKPSGRYICMMLEALGTFDTAIERIRPGVDNETAHCFKVQRLSSLSPCLCMAHSQVLSAPFCAASTRNFCGLYQGYMGVESVPFHGTFFWTSAKLCCPVFRYHQNTTQCVRRRRNRCKGSCRDARFC